MKQKNRISCIAIVLCLFWLVGTIGYAFASKQSFEPQKDKSQTEVSAYQTKAVVQANNPLNPKKINPKQKFRHTKRKQSYRLQIRLCFVQLISLFLKFYF